MRTSGNLARGVNERVKEIQNPALREAAGTLANGVPSGITNMIQMGTAMVLGIPPGIAGEVSTALMGVNAAGASTYQGLQEGKSNSDAMVSGFVDGLTEWATEHMGLSDRIELLGKVAAGEFAWTAKNIGKSLAARGGAEMMEELVGNLAGQTWDIYWNGTDSEYYQRQQQYRAQGYGAREAAEKAATEVYVHQSIEAMAAAAVSVVFMDGANVAQGVLQGRDLSRAGKQLREAGFDTEVLQKGQLLKNGGDEEFRALADKAQRDFDGGKLSDLTLGQLSLWEGARVERLILEADDKGGVAAGAARVLLRQAAGREGGLKLTAEDVRMLQSAVAYQAEAEEDTETMLDIRRRAGMIDPEGNPLPTFAEFLEESRKFYPDMGEEEAAQMYHQFLGDSVTVGVGGQRMNFAAFRAAVERESPQAGIQATAQLFDRLLTQQLRDGLDAIERETPRGLTHQQWTDRLSQGNTRQRGLEQTRAELETALGTHTAVRALV